MKKAVIYPIYRPLDSLYQLKKEYPDIDFQICLDREKLPETLHDAEIFITGPCTREMVEPAPHLKWIQCYFAGIDAYPMEEIRQRGIILTSGQGIASIQMAEYAICAMIMMARNLPVLARRQQQKKWDRAIVQHEINGATVGILGLGVIGKEIAKKAHLMGMKVIAIDQARYEGLEYIHELYTPDDMAEIFKNSDYVINLLPHYPATDGIIAKRYFDLMKPEASFINMSRGKTVNEEDLIEVLRSNRIRGMVSDVFYNEPLESTSPLWDLENVFITPHLAGLSSKYLEKACVIIRYNLDVYLKGEGTMKNLVDYKRGF